MTAPGLSPGLYPDSPPFNAFALPVSAGHVLQVREFGVADGVPALVLHGGPGSGCSPLLWRVFDPARYRVICLDQRGAGGSTPRGGTACNDTDQLLADICRLRQQLGLASWLVVGGSWGATLALAYAALEPGAVQALLLRASFLACAEDIDGFFQGAASLLPAAWQCFAAAAPAGHRQALLPWLAQVFAQGEPAADRAADRAAMQAAALAWWAWEQALIGTPDPGPAPAGEALLALVDRYRVQSHFLLHGCWLRERPLLQRCAAVPRVPILLLHADDDRVCRPQGALALQQRLPGAALQWVAAAGHDAAHPAMVAAMVAALDRFAAGGDFGVRP